MINWSGSSGANLGIERAEGKDAGYTGLLLLEPLPGFMNTRLRHRRRVVFLNDQAFILRRRRPVIHGRVVRGRRDYRELGWFRPGQTHSM
jgi:hypothetical protein